jgi:hypothetical protein
MYDELSKDEWLALRLAEAKLIDPATAKITIMRVNLVDPYGLGWDPDGEYMQVGKTYFARRPESNIWVWFEDIPNEVCVELLRRQNFDHLDDDDGFLW